VVSGMGTNLKFRVGLALLTSALALSGCAGPTSDGVSEEAAEQGLTEPCNVEYDLNTYIGNDGKPALVAQVYIENYAEPISGWTLNWTFLAGEQIVFPFNGNVVQDLDSATATGLSYNKDIGTGQSVNFGFTATSTTTAVTPTSFTLSGQTCSIN